MSNNEDELIVEQEDGATWWTSQVSRDERNALLEDEQGLEQGLDHAGCCSFVVST